MYCFPKLLLYNHTQKRKKESLAQRCTENITRSPITYSPQNNRHSPHSTMDFPVAQMVKNVPAVQETRV